MIDVAMPERAEEMAARWRDAQHRSIETSALMPSRGEEG
jgi:hypothetical protein